MKTISIFMLELMERLAEMFPGSDYQSRMERYIANRHPQNAADIEHLQRQYQYEQQREGIV
jgi:hypothetical protein